MSVLSNSAKEGPKAPLATTLPILESCVCVEPIRSSFLSSFASVRKARVPFLISFLFSISYDTIHSFMKPLIAKEKSSNQISELWASGTFFSFARVMASSQVFSQAIGSLGALVRGLLAALYKDLASLFNLTSDTPTCSLSFPYQPLRVSFGSHA